MTICLVCQKEFRVGNRSKTCSIDCGKKRLKSVRKAYRQLDTSVAKSKQHYKDNRESCRAASERSRVKYRNTLQTNKVKRVALIVKSLKGGASRRNLIFSIDAETIYNLIIIQGDKCILTGMAFDWNWSEDFRTSPFAPSVDRIDSTKGYTYDNIQIVCYIVNLAKNQFPVEIFDLMCKERIGKLNAKTQN